MVSLFAAEYTRLLDNIDFTQSGSSSAAFGGMHAKSHYLSQQELPGGLFLSSNAPGRWELKPLDHRDGGAAVKKPLSSVSELVEPLICPPGLVAVLNKVL